MEKVKEEAELYSEYVREKLGDILSSAVADVAAARPEDPINFLAHRLYTTRRQHNTVTCSAGSGPINTRPSLGFATLRPRPSHSNRATRSRLTRYRPENEMSQIYVNTVKKTEKTTIQGVSDKSSSSVQGPNVFRRLGIDDNGQLPVEKQHNQKENEFFGGNKEIARPVHTTGDHVLQDATSSRSRRNVFETDDEGFEETTSSGSNTKPVFVHLCLKNNLSDLHCDLFDDYDLT